MQEIFHPKVFKFKLSWINIMKWVSMSIHWAFTQGTMSQPWLFTTLTPIRNAGKSNHPDLEDDIYPEKKHWFRLKLEKSVFHASRPSGACKTITFTLVRALFPNNLQKFFLYLFPVCDVCWQMPLFGLSGGCGTLDLEKCNSKKL